MTAEERGEADPGPARDAALAAVPALDTMLARTVAAVPFAGAFRFLDLGAGSGRLAARMLAAFGQARGTLLETSAALTDAARARLGADAARAEWSAVDHGHGELPRGFEVVTSLFGLHALADIERRALYREVYAALVPDGVALFADVVRAATATLQAAYEAAWVRAAASAGVDADAVAAAATQFAAGRGMGLGNELPWLGNIGFRDVDIVWKDQGFAVFTARRPAAVDFDFARSRGDEDGRNDG